MEDNIFLFLRYLYRHGTSFDGLDKYSEYIKLS